MTDIQEQCINIKFCFELGKMFTKTHEMLKNIYGDVMNDLSDLRMVSSQHMMSRIWDGRQRHLTTLMLCKFVKSCILIIV
jgi:hypothetical protein